MYGPRADLEAYRKIQMRRLYVEKWIQEPYFDSMCKGCFIRVYIGLVDNVAVYRMCEVVGLMPYKKTYKLPGTNIVTDKVFLVSIGSNQTTVKIHLVSNSRLVETELQFYDRELKNQNKIAISLKVCMTIQYKTRMWRSITSNVYISISFVCFSVYQRVTNFFPITLYAGG